ERLSRPLAARVVSHLAAGQRVLDIGTGTGIVALQAAEKGATVLGIDLSEGMLAYAAAKARGRAEFRRMDAEALELPDGSFEAVRRYSRSPACGIGSDDYRRFSANNSSRPVTSTHWSKNTPTRSSRRNQPWQGKD